MSRTPKERYSIYQLQPDAQEAAVNRYRKKAFWMYNDELNKEAKKLINNKIAANPILSVLRLLSLDYQMDGEIRPGLQFECYFDFDYKRDYKKLEPFCSKGEYETLKNLDKTLISAFIYITVRDPKIYLDCNPIGISHNIHYKKEFVSKDTIDKYVPIIEDMNNKILKAVVINYSNLFSEAVDIYYRVMNADKMKEDITDLGWEFFESGRKAPERK